MKSGLEVYDALLTAQVKANGKEHDFVKVRIAHIEDTFLVGELPAIKTDLLLKILVIVGSINDKDRIW